MLNVFKRALLASAAGILVSNAAFALEPGPYLGLGIGLNLPRDSNVILRIPASPSGAAAVVDFNGGPIVLGTFGYKWTGGFRTELEAGYRQTTFKSINARPASGSQKVKSLSANLLYDFDTGSSITPYLGVGLGVAGNAWRNVGYVGSPVFTDSQTSLQLKAIGGLSVRITERLDGFVDYHLIGLASKSFDSAPAGSRISGHGDRSHNIMIGFRYALNAPQRAVVAEAPRPSPPPPPPPPPAQPARVAPPPPPAVPAKFIVFFDYDRAILRADARKIVDEAVDYARKNGKASIHATGHADTSGGAAYNMGLSERRARAVMAALAERGITERDVVAAWKGESEPLVSTGDGVKEPQNRRVEITLD